MLIIVYVQRLRLSRFLDFRLTEQEQTPLKIKWTLILSPYLRRHEKLRQTCLPWRTTIIILQIKGTMERWIEKVDGFFPLELFSVLEGSQTEALEEVREGVLGSKNLLLSPWVTFIDRLNQNQPPKKNHQHLGFPPTQSPPLMSILSISTNYPYKQYHYLNAGNIILSIATQFPSCLNPFQHITSPALGS